MLLTQSQNSAAGNRPFMDKLEIYNREDSMIRQQHEISKFCKRSEETNNLCWDKDCIKNRLQHIVKQSLEVIWNFNNI